jgi:hypothetical protein
MFHVVPSDMSTASAEYDALKCVDRAELATLPPRIAQAAVDQSCNRDFGESKIFPHWSGEVIWMMRNECDAWKALAERPGLSSPKTSEVSRVSIQNPIASLDSASPLISRRETHAPS